MYIVLYWERSCTFSDYVHAYSIFASFSVPSRIYFEITLTKWFRTLKFEYTSFFGDVRLEESSNAYRLW